MAKQYSKIWAAAFGPGKRRGDRQMYISNICLHPDTGLKPLGFFWFFVGIGYAFIDSKKVAEKR